MKKLGKILCIITMLCLLIVTLVACNDSSNQTNGSENKGDGTTGNHEYSEWIPDGPKGHIRFDLCHNQAIDGPYEHRLEPAGKDVTGEIVYKCSLCGYETNDECSHFKTSEHVISPTCLEDGYTATICEICHETLWTYDEVPATGHKWKYSKLTDPDEEHGGTLSAVCEYDDEHTDEVAIPALNTTDYTVREKAATCDTDGTRYFVYEIGRIGIIRGQTFEYTVTIPMIGHTPDSDNICSVCSDNLNYEYTVTGNTCTLTKYVGTATEVVVPQTIKNYKVTYIGEEAFADANVTKVTVPDNSLGINISAHAFKNCKQLVELELFNSTHLNTVIAASAFEDCVSLEKLTVKIDLLGNFYLKNLKEVTILNGSSNAIAAETFKGCYQLEKVTFGDRLKSIGASAFEDCYSLTCITLPASLETIGENAFEDCYKLVEIYNLSNLNIYLNAPNFGQIALHLDAIHTSLDEDSILHTTEDGFIYYTSRTRKTYLLSYIGTETQLTLPEELNGGAYEVHNYAFYNRSEITAVTIPANVTAINSSAFTGCVRLHEVYNLSSINVELGSYTNGCVGLYANAIHQNVTDDSIYIQNGDWTFIQVNGDYQLVGYTGTDLDITLPADYNGSDYSVADYAFYGNNRLSSIALPDSVTEIGQYAFGNISANIALGETIATISPYMFAEYLGSSIILPDSVREIAQHAFFHCERLTAINIPDDVTAIGSQAFMYCSSLSAVTLPSELQSLGTSAFAYSAIESIVIPSGITTINDAVFSYCHNLTSITLHAGITELKNGAFNECSSLENVYYAGSIEDWCNIEIETDWNSETVTSTPMAYANHFFADGDYDNEVTSITLPTTITEIGDSQFYGFNNVTEFIFHDDLEGIGDLAFYNCASVTELCVSNGSKFISVGRAAFGGCSSLESLTLIRGYRDGIGGNSSYSFKDYYPFGYYFGTANLNKTGFYRAQQQWYRVYNSNYAPTEYTSVTYAIPFSLKHVVLNGADSYLGYDVIDYQFANCIGLVSVSLQAKTKNVGERAFYNCTSLETVNLENVTKIDEYAFYGCTSLDDVNIDKVTEIKTYSFANCRSLSNIDLSGVIQLDSYAFYNCTSLIDVDLSNATTIGSSAFQYCTAIVHVTMNNATTVETRAFSNCTNLAKLSASTNVIDILSSSNFTDRITELVVTGGDYINRKFFLNKIVTLRVLDGDTEIASSAFDGYGSLENVYLPDDIQVVGSYAFDNTPWLAKKSGVVYIGKTMYTIIASDDSEDYKSLTLREDTVYIAEIPAFVEELFIPENITDISYDSNAFKLANLQVLRATTPVAMKIRKAKTILLCGDYDIPEHAFASNTDITAVEILGNVQNIGNSAFYGCTNLQTVAFPDSLNYIGSGAFYNCRNLQAVDLSSTTLQTVSEYSFYTCVSLETVKLPDSLETIGVYAFYGCSNLQTVQLSDNITYIGTDAFTDTPWYNSSDNADEDGFVYVGNILLSYKGDATTVTVKEGTTAIFSKAFASSSIQGICLPDSLTSIGAGAFESCTSLTTITTPTSTSNNYLPSALEYLGESAFAGCTNLVTIRLNTTALTILDKNVFNGCTSLRTVYIPNLTEIGEGAFRGCTAMTSLPTNTTNTLPASLTTIGDYAFYGCSKLSSSYFSSSKVETIGNSAFYGCSSFKDNNSGQLTLPRTLKTIGDSAFCGCSSITFIFFNEALQTIGDGAFSGLSNLESATDLEKTNLTYLGNSAFSSTGITEIALPNTLESIGERTFYNCTSLKRVTLPATLESIGENAFYSCTAMTSINLPNSLTSIDGNAFYNCTKLTNITLPNSLTSIGINVFRYCSSLTTIYFDGTVDEWNAISKDSKWNYGSSFTEVICNDEVVEL